MVGRDVLKRASRLYPAAMFANHVKTYPLSFDAIAAVHDALLGYDRSGRAPAGTRVFQTIMSKYSGHIGEAKTRSLLHRSDTVGGDVVVHELIEELDRLGFYTLAQLGADLLGCGHQDGARHLGDAIYNPQDPLPVVLIPNEADVGIPARLDRLPVAWLPLFEKEGTRHLFERLHPGMMPRDILDFWCQRTDGEALTPTTQLHTVYRIYRSMDGAECFPLDVGALRYILRWADLMENEIMTILRRFFAFGQVSISRLYATSPAQKNPLPTALAIPILEALASDAPGQTPLWYFIGMRSDERTWRTTFRPPTRGRDPVQAVVDYLGTLDYSLVALAEDLFAFGKTREAAALFAFLYDERERMEAERQGRKYLGFEPFAVIDAVAARSTAFRGAHDDHEDADPMEGVEDQDAWRAPIVSAAKPDDELATGDVIRAWCVTFGSGPKGILTTDEVHRLAAAWGCNPTGGDLVFHLCKRTDDTGIAQSSSTVLPVAYTAFAQIGAQARFPSDRAGLITRLIASGVSRPRASHLVDAFLSSHQSPKPSDVREVKAPSLARPVMPSELSVSPFVGPTIVINTGKHSIRPGELFQMPAEYLSAPLVLHSSQWAHGRPATPAVLNEVMIKEAWVPIFDTLARKGGLDVFNDMWRCGKFSTQVINFLYMAGMQGKKMSRPADVLPLVWEVFTRANDSIVGDGVPFPTPAKLHTTLVHSGFTVADAERTVAAFTASHAGHEDGNVAAIYSRAKQEAEEAANKRMALALEAMEAQNRERIRREFEARDKQILAAAAPIHSDGGDECAICLERIDGRLGIFLPCGHIGFHYDCVKGLAACPMCREKVTSIVPGYRS